MSYPINSKINPYQQQTPMGMNSDSAGNNGVPMGVSSSGVHDNLVNNSPTVKGVVHGERKWLTWALLAPVWAAMIYPMNKFNDACKGDFDGSLIGKVSKWAENRGNNRFLQSKVFKTMGDKWSGLKKWFMETAVPKSRILSAMIKTPSKPESHMVLMMAGGATTELAADAAQKLKMLYDNAKDDVAKADVLKKMGITAPELEQIAELSHEYPDKILKICENLGKTNLDRFQHTRVAPIPFTKGKFVSEVIPGAHKLLDTDVHFSAYANKMKAVKSANKTWLGRFVPKAMLRTIEGITNGTAGGKFAIGMAAFFIADSIKDAINAPKGDKVSTFAESNIHGLGFYLLMPLMIGVMHMFGGLRYLGMDAEQLKQYRAKIKAFDKEATSLAEKGTKAHKAEWKAARKKLVAELAQMRKGVTPNDAKIHIPASRLKKIFYWPIKKVAGAVTFGLDTPKGFYKNNAHFWEKLFASPGVALKKFAGYPLRFGLVTVLISPYFINPILKVSHMIFGKPKNSVMDDGKEPEPQRNQHPRPVVMPQRAPQSTMTPTAYNTDATFERQNLLDNYKAKYAAPEPPPASVMMPVQQPAPQMYTQYQQPQPMMPVQQTNGGMYAQYLQAQQPVPVYPNYSNVYAPYAPPQPQLVAPNYQNYATYAPYQYPQQVAYQPQQVMPMYQPQQPVMQNYQMPANGYVAAAPAMMPAKTEPARTYVPSASGVAINPSVAMQENAKANEAFLKADRAEQRAMGHVD